MTLQAKQLEWKRDDDELLHVEDGFIEGAQLFEILRLKDGGWSLRSHLPDASSTIHDSLEEAKAKVQSQLNEFVNATGEVVE
jgi:hypothetical protein